MGLEAATKALLEAGITYDEIETAFVGYCYGKPQLVKVKGFHF
jgi:sterol carrier protein 2